MGFVFAILVALCIQPRIKAQERSCSALLLKEPSTPRGSYTIDPDGPGRNPPFQVYCDMSKDGGVTLVSHDSENRTRVFGFNDPGSYKRIVHYTNASLAQVVRLARISVNCKQFIKYECLHSRLEKFAWWVSRNNQARTYWGDTGINRGDDICECALPDNTCADPRKGCNCDINDHQWRSDSGYLSWKPDLPVIQLRFGDTNKEFTEEGYHTLGKLECSGQQDINDCDTNPCLNGGVCIDAKNDFSCNCEPGYGGKICDTGNNSITVTLRMKLDEWDENEFQHGMARGIYEYCIDDSCSRIQRKLSCHSLSSLSQINVRIIGKPLTSLDTTQVKFVVLVSSTEDIKPTPIANTSLLTIIQEKAEHIREQLGGFEIIYVNGERPSSENDCTNIQTDEISSGGNKTLQGAAIGGLVAVLCLVVVLICGVLCYRRKLQVRDNQNENGNDEERHYGYIPDFTRNIIADQEGIGPRQEAGIPPADILHNSRRVSSNVDGYAGLDAPRDGSYASLENRTDGASLPAQQRQYEQLQPGAPADPSNGGSARNQGIGLKPVREPVEHSCGPDEYKDMTGGNHAVQCTEKP